MSISVCELSCDDKNKGAEELFRSLITTTDDGCFTVRSEATTPLDSSCEGLTCEEANISWDQIFRKLLFTDTDGCITLRIINVNT
jgi:hypothetical protein